MRENVKAGEIQIGSIQNIEGSGFRDQIVEGVDIVDFPLGNLDKRWDVATQIEKRMQFDGSLAASKSGPGEKSKAKVDRGGVERISCLFQVDAEIVVGVKTSGCSNQSVGEIGIHAPVPCFVGAGQSVSSDASANAHVVEFRVHCPETDFDVPKTFAASQLGEGHHQKLIEA